MSLTPRGEILLRTLIDKYIFDGHPVGSKALAKESGLTVSSATIRNVMVDLEQLGLIQSPHTSAGRIPTIKGYRVFVDSIVKAKSFNSNRLNEIAKQFEGEHDPQQVLNKASSLLSQLTNFAGVVMMPTQSNSAFRQIEFLPLSAGRILAILITDDGRVQNRVITVDKSFKPNELIEAANYFNHQFAGLSLKAVRRQLLKEIKEHSEQMNQLISNAMKIAQRFFEAEKNNHDDNVVVTGEENLFEVPEFDDINKMRVLFETFKTKHDLLGLLDKSLKSKGVQIFIGEESGYEPLNDCSIVTSTYEIDDQCLGVLGVIGPTRMQYADVISAVDITSKLVTSALTGHNYGE